MKKLLISTSVLALLLPALASAAAGDVTLTTDVTLSVNSITLNVSAATASIESIDVGSTSFAITLPSGSSFQVVAPELNQLIADNTLWQTASTTCTGTASALGYNNVGGSSITVTVIPSATLCADAAVAASSSKGDARGGGGATTVATAAVAAEAAQIQTLQAQLASLMAQIALLTGTPVSTVSPGTVSGKLNLTANMTKGTRGANVKALQQFLNTHGFVVASSGPGSPGNETDLLGNLTVQAIQKFQKQYGIADVGTPGYGTVGPKTRAKINELSAK